METKIFNGNRFSENIDNQTKEMVEKFRSIRGRNPRFLDIDWGISPEASIYGRSKIRKGSKLGIDVTFMVTNKNNEKNPVKSIEESISEIEPDGVILERPFPQWISMEDMENLIPEYMDVEGISYRTMGQNLYGIETVIPATAMASYLIIQQELKEYGKNICIVNRSPVIGRPLMAYLINHDYTVTVCHSKTKELSKVTKNSDIIVTATGVKNYLNDAYIRKGAAVIDVGIIQTDNGITGDADFESLNGKAGFITPVPGGVGPVTTSVLFNNFMKINIERIKNRISRQY
ncbi:tetrahydrofolate dehydrogenase/cyclohydrolase catalytic domain-containing protein [Caldiplasma sukawensis]